MRELRHQLFGPAHDEGLSLLLGVLACEAYGGRPRRFLGPAACLGGDMVVVIVAQLVEIRTTFNGNDAAVRVVNRSFAPSSCRPRLENIALQTYIVQLRIGLFETK